MDKDYLLFNSECIDIMMHYISSNSVDFILCDLPYGVTSCHWDSVIPFEQMWNAIFSVRKCGAAICLFGQEPFSSLLRCSNLKEYKYDIYWEKERLVNINQVKRRVGKTVECISVFYDKQCTYHPQMRSYSGPKRTNKVKNGKLGKLSDAQEKKVFAYNDIGLRYPTQVWSFKRDILTSNLHPTQKPVALLEELINTFSNPGDTVLDFCMGSGSTGVASLNLNRKFIGVEIDKNYFDIAKNRIENCFPA